jgi:hypothetical protein
VSRDIPDFRIVLSAFFVFSAMMLAAIAYPRGEFVLVVGGPDSTEAGMMKIISDAGGTFVAQGNFGWLAVAHAEATGFPSRLMRAGAFIVLDHALASGCLERK